MLYLYCISIEEKREYNVFIYIQVYLLVQEEFILNFLPILVPFCSCMQVHPTLLMIICPSPTYPALSAFKWPLDVNGKINYVHTLNIAARQSECCVSQNTWTIIITTAKIQ